MATRYHDVAPEVVSKTEMLTGLIKACSRVQSVAARMIELENDIYRDKKKPEVQEFNVTRDMVKRVADMEEYLLALGYMSSQQTDSRLIKAAQIEGLNRLVKLEHHHPQVRTIVAKRIGASSDDADFKRLVVNWLETKKVMDKIPNPYTTANMEDFDDE